MPVTRRLATSLTIVFLLAGGCDDTPELPPENGMKKPPPETTQDFDHFASVTGDQRCTIPHLALVLQHDRDGSLGLTLLSRQPGPDGSRILFGTLERVAAPGDLVGREIDFGGAPRIDPRGNGIFTPIAIYHPKLATFTIQKLDDQEATGVIRGTFHKFRAALPGIRPEDANLEIHFNAKVISK